MKSAILIAMCITVFITGQSVMAQDGNGRFSVGANVSYVDIASTGKDVNIEYDSNVLYGASLTYYLDKHFSCELSIGYFQLDVDATGNGMTFGFGDLQQFPVLLTARYHLPIKNGMISPYLGGGGGYYFNNFDTSQRVTLAGGNIHTDNSFAFHLNSGIEFYVKKDIAITLDFKYIWNETDGVFTMVGVAATDDMDLNTLLIGVGFKILLNSD